MTYLITYRKQLYYAFLNCRRFSFEGVLQAIYGFDRDELECGCNNPMECLFVDPKTVLRGLDVEDAKFHLDLIILCAFFAVLRVACYLVLRWRVRIH